MLDKETVSCGQCPGCRLERSRQWAVRIMHEAKLHEHSCFVTLTYDDEHLTPGYTLNLADWQNFMKRLRHRMLKPPFRDEHLIELPPDAPFEELHQAQRLRFFHAGEYGKTSERPHLHACIFGTAFLEDRKFHTRTSQGNVLYVSKILEETWGKGYAPIGDLTFESAAYVARYIMKKWNGDDNELEHGFVDHLGEVFPRKTPYTTMSRRPGLGTGWFKKYGSDVYPDDFVVVNGKKTRTPKFYDGLLEYVDPSLLESIKNRRVENAKRHSKNNTERRLQDREHILLKKIDQLKRTI